MTPTKITETLDQIAKLRKGTLFVQNAGLVLGTYESYFNGSNLKALREYIEQLEAKNAILREGVEHYADKETWAQSIEGGGDLDLYAPVYVEFVNGPDHAINVLVKHDAVEGK